VPSTDRAGRRRGPASLPATLAVRDWRRQTPVRACNVLSDSVAGSWGERIDRQPVAYDLSSCVSLLVVIP
jgi:hypothetical protein